MIGAVTLAQLVPPVAFAAFALWLATRSAGPVRVFWNLNALHGVIWAAAQSMWTYYDANGGVPVISPTDPVFYAASVPIAAALYGRPDRDRPRWLFDIALLDVVLITLFAAFLYLYFVVSVAVTSRSEAIYQRNLMQLMNAGSLLLACWAIWIWRTAAPAWRTMLGVYAAGLSLALLAAVTFDLLDLFGWYARGSAIDAVRALPFVVMAAAAVIAYRKKLFESDHLSPEHVRMSIVSLIAIGLLVAIPAIDEVARRVLNPSEVLELLRTRLALAILIPFGVVVVVREYRSRRALIRAGQELLFTREQLVQKEKLAAVGQLVSGIAHELNNPLQGVLGYAELMLAEKPQAGETEELRAIRNNANRAASIVRNLLAFAGRSGSTRGWHQLNTVVRDALASRQAQLKDANVMVTLATAERLPLVYVDPARIEDVVVNLVQNAETAIEARRRGTASAAGEIAVNTRFEHNPDRIVIEVADNGVGLRQEDLHRVFEPFFTRQDTGQGTGLGLSVCYGIVREHGGQMVARNRDGGGAIFVVELPVMSESLLTASASIASAESLQSRAKAAPVPSYAMAPPPEDDMDSSSRRRRALVVDDEESNAALVRRVLTTAGYDVESTTISPRALVMIERTPYDAVISDVKMPELSGQELYSRVCQLRPEMARRFIFITGDIDGEGTRQFLEESRCSYFMKPFNLDRLTSAVDLLTGRAASNTIG